VDKRDSGICFRDSGDSGRGNVCGNALKFVRGCSAW